jgi:acyl-CoA thioesterase FadM
MAAHELKIDQIGIKDIDGYGHIWYGHYVKFFERAYREFLGQQAQTKVVECLKYAKSVPWGAVGSRIETYVVEQDTKTDCIIFQRWIVSESDNTTITPDNVHGMAIFHVSAVGRPITPSLGTLKLQGGPQLTISVRGLRGSSVQGLQVDLTVGTVRRLQRLYSDMLSEGRLSIIDTLDLFEQTRTDMVGGQAGLKKLKDQHRELVIARMDGLVRHDVSLVGRSHVESLCILRRVHLDRRCFDFQQIILSDKTEVASMFVMLCCVDPTQQAMASVEQTTLDGWVRNNMTASTS